MEFPRTPSFDLTGKRALVAGASSGIGLGCAVALAEHGAEVTLVARSGDKLKAVADAMAAEGWSAKVMELDITDLSALKAKLADQPAFDIVVNSAGLARHSLALDTQPEDYDAVMDVNLRAAYFLSVEAARAMQAAGKPGSILHISSQMGHVGGVDRAVYSATKHGIEGMVKSMAIEWGPKGIRINTICPTFIRTPLAEQTLSRPERRAWIEEKIKLGRVGEIEDVMGAVVFLASDASALITGTALLVDGGWTAD